jgi:hypothetical protein
MTADPMLYTRYMPPPGMLAADLDRDRAADVLSAGFADGRLTKAEYDERMGHVYAARTYGQLHALVADLPFGPMGVPVQHRAARVPLQPPLSSQAVAALVCGLGALPTLGLTTIPAIILGNLARRMIRKTGQRGEGMAMAGVVLGWAGVALAAMVLVSLLTVAATAPHIVHTEPVIKPGTPVGAPAFPGTKGIGG